MRGQPESWRVYQERLQRRHESNRTVVIGCLVGAAVMAAIGWLTHFMRG